MTVHTSPLQPSAAALAHALTRSPTDKAAHVPFLCPRQRFSTTSTRNSTWKRTNLNHSERTPPASAACGPASLRGAEWLGQDKHTNTVQVFRCSRRHISVIRSENRIAVVWRWVEVKVEVLLREKLKAPLRVCTLARLSAGTFPL